MTASRAVKGRQSKPKQPGVSRPMRDIRNVRMESFRPSVFQPHGRPSGAAVEAVKRAVAAVGSLEALVGDDGAAELSKLDTEARELAEFAADVAAHGVESPVEARRTPSGLELLAGHRRVAAARLAGLSEVPVRDLGEIPDYEAAVIVFRRNRLRADFTPWQEARALQQLHTCRREAGVGEDNIRALARVMGYSNGRASELLAMTRAFPAAVLERLGQGFSAAGEEILCRLPYRALRELLKIRDVDRRIGAARRIAGMNRRSSGSAYIAAPPRQSRFFRRDTRRSGGYTLTVFRSLDDVSPVDARVLLDILEREARLVRERIRVLEGETS